MKTWRQPSFALLSLLAMLFSMLPQVAWSCPMTGRIGNAATICLKADSSPVPTKAAHCLSIAQKKTHACCKKKSALAKTFNGSAAKAKSTHAGCTNPGGPCCKIVRLPGKSCPATTPSAQHAVAHPQQVAGSVVHAPLFAIVPQVPVMALPFALFHTAPRTQSPLHTQQFAASLRGRAPPIS